MADRKSSLIEAGLAQSVRVLVDAAGSSSFKLAMAAIAHAWIESLEGGGKILFAGNGGSAADAQHIAGELVSRLNYDRAPLAGLALTTDTSILTAVGNDYGYREVFARQIRALGRPGDILVAISTSGRSPNILAALEAARRSELVTVGFGGAEATPMDELCDLLLKAPSSNTPMIQQVHMAAAHIICGLVEAELFPRAEI